MHTTAIHASIRSIVLSTRYSTCTLVQVVTPSDTVQYAYVVLEYEYHNTHIKPQLGAEPEHDQSLFVFRFQVQYRMFLCSVL